MNDLLSGRRAIVTGASSGIGRAIASALLECGAQVLLTGRNSERLEAAAQGYANARVYACDLTAPGAPESVVAACVSEFGGLDILINNAGYAFKAEVTELPVHAFDECYAVNVRAPFLLCRAAYPHLIKSAAPSVVNIGSVVGHKGYETQCAYGCSKHALEGLTKVLAREWHEDGIRVHLISPGSVNTEMGFTMRPELNRDMVSRPEEIADVAVFLLTHRGNTVIDEVRTHRYTAKPWA